MSGNRGTSTLNLERPGKLNSSSSQQRTRFSYGAGPRAADANLKNSKERKALWHSQDENAPVESQLIDAKLMNSQLEVSSCLLFLCKKNIYCPLTPLALTSFFFLFALGS